MGWRDYNQGNLSAFDSDRSGSCRIENASNYSRTRREKEKTKSRQNRLGDIRVSSLDVRNEGSLKPKKARSDALAFILSGSKSSAVLVCPDSQEEEISLFLMRMQFILFNLFSGATEEKNHESDTVGRETF